MLWPLRTCLCQMFHCGWASVTLTLSTSIDLQRRQEGALGETAQGPKKRTEEDPVYPLKPSLLPASPSAPSLQREEHLSWVWPWGQMIPRFFTFHTALARAGHPHTLRNLDACQGGVPADVIPFFATCQAGCDGPFRDRLFSALPFLPGLC